MRLERTFKIPKKRGEFVLVSWDPGYRNLVVEYENKEIISIDNPRRLMEGAEFTIEGLGDLKIVLQTEPYILEVFLNGLHSPSNSNHPFKTIESIGFNFIFPFILNFILYTATKDLEDTHGSYFNMILSTFFGVSFIIYSASIILILFKKIVGYYIGSGLFYIQFLLFFYTWDNLIRWNEDFLVVIIGIMVIQAIALPFGLIKVAQFQKNMEDEPQFDEDILDSEF